MTWPMRLLAIRLINMEMISLTLCVHARSGIPLYVRVGVVWYGLGNGSSRVLICTLVIVCICTLESV